MGSTSATIAALEYGGGLFPGAASDKSRAHKLEYMGGLSISNRVMGYLHFRILLSYDREPSRLVLVTIQASILSCPYHELCPYTIRICIYI